MTKKTRLAILLGCAACFLIFSPVLVLYSMGYRFDLEAREITTTGGIYVKTYPAPGEIIFDSQKTERPGIFSDSVFVQSLIPKEHTVLIKKDGYFDYFKTLPVKEKEVTKLERVLLIKKVLNFYDFGAKIEYFSMAPDEQHILTAAKKDGEIIFSYSAINNPSLAKVYNLKNAGSISETKWSNDSNSAIVEITGATDKSYYLFKASLTADEPNPIKLIFLSKATAEINFNPLNKDEIFFVKSESLYLKKNLDSAPVIKGVSAYAFYNGNILWLGTDGFLYSSSMAGELLSKVSEEKVQPAKNYELESVAGKIFLAADNSLFLLDHEKRLFVPFQPEAVGNKIISSPNNETLIVWNDKNVLAYSFLDKTFKKLYFGNKISGLGWINNEYLLIQDGTKIVISETDWRSNVNTVVLPDPADSAYFNRREGRLYILRDSSLNISEKITP